MSQFQNPFANMPPVAKNLLIINIICFIPYMVFSESFYDANFVNTMGVFYFDSPLFKIWQPITHMFFHGGWMHIIFNMFALYSFGMAVEYTMGSKRFFSFYFICGLGAIALQLLVQGIEAHAITGHFINPDITRANLLQDSTYLKYGMAEGQKLFNIYNGPMVGASGAIFGLLIAFGMLYPNAELMIMFIPVPVKAKYVIPAYMVFELFSGIYQFSGDSVAHFAHIGGALIGFIVIKLWGIKKQDNFF